MKKFFKILFGTALIFALLINALIVHLTLCWNNTQYLSDLSGSVWYCEETNMKATVYAYYGEMPYMLIVDLDDGREYKVDSIGDDDMYLYKGNPDTENDLTHANGYCKCGTSLEVKRIFLKVRGFEIDVADGCWHFPCDATFLPDKDGVTENISVPEPPEAPVIKPNPHIEKRQALPLAKEDEYLLEAFKQSKEEDIAHFEVLEIEGEKYVFARAYDRDFGYLYKVIENEAEIEFEYADLHGHPDWFEIGVAEMSQGRFLTAVSASYAGNGGLLLASDEAEYGDWRTIGICGSMYDNEWIEGFNYVDEYGANAVGYYGGHMTPNYRDVDGDGHTDIVLTGVQFVRNRARTGIVAEYDCEYVYIYDVDEDEFILDVSRSRHDAIHGT